MIFVAIYNFFIILLFYLNFEIEGIQCLIWPCQRTSDCNSIIKNTTCVLGNCVCQPGFVLSTNLTKCIPAVLYGDKCTESVQCSYMPSRAICKNGVCQCDDGFTYIQGRCKILNSLNGTCTETTDCKFGSDRESVICRNGKCMCADGYYERSTVNCRRISMDIGDDCIVDSDCDSVAGGAKCIAFKCKNITNNKRRCSSILFKEIATQTSFADLNFYTGENHSSGSSDKKKHDNEENIELSTLSPASEIETKKYGGSCTNSGQPCENLHHSICVENFCQCKLGYYHDQNSGICKAELGERADGPEYCTTSDPNGPQYNNTTSLCICLKNFHYEPNLRACKKPIQFGASCTSNSQCTPFGAAFCNTTSFPKQCTCESYAEYDEKRQLCDPKTGLGAFCTNNQNCQIRNSICSTDHICICKSKYVARNGTCLAGIDSECKKNDDCGVENSTCISPTMITNSKFEIVNNTCQCKKGFVHFEDQCLKAATEYGDDCAINEQCKPLLSELAICHENKCECDPKDHLSYGKCEEKRNIDEKCQRASQCYTPDESKAVECRNGLCKCRFGYEHDPSTHICIKPKSNSSSGGPSMLKIVTFILIGSAFFITSAAIKQAYY